MPIDPSRALGFEFPENQSSWNADQVILYHLGVGAGVPPTDPKELEYTYEGHLKVLPSFAVIPVFSSLAGVLGVPGLDFNPMMLLHGEQEIEVMRALPLDATALHRGRIAAIYDKGKAAVVVIDVTSEDDRGEPLFVNRFSVFLRGEGGFGGESGPEPGNRPPAREPDGVVESPTLPQQALLYRLSGDKNPLHADPSFAAMGGFDRPILHGLCSYGIACKAIVDHALGGDVTRVARYAARFRGVVFPGETLVTRYWREGERIVLEVDCKERQKPVISNAAITLRV